MMSSFWSCLIVTFMEEIVHSFLNIDPDPEGHHTLLQNHLNFGISLAIKKHHTKSFFFWGGAGVSKTVHA